MAPVCLVPLLVQAWLQEFAWTEEELPQRLRERQSTLAHADSSRHKGGQEDKASLMAELAREPMFCFEVGERPCGWPGSVRMGWRAGQRVVGCRAVWRAMLCSNVGHKVIQGCA